MGFRARRAAARRFVLDRQTPNQPLAGGDVKPFLTSPASPRRRGRGLGRRPKVLCSLPVLSYVQYCLEVFIARLAGLRSPLQFPAYSPFMVILDPLDEIKFLLPDQEKVAFKRACFMSDTTMARELRRFVREYIHGACGSRECHSLVSPKERPREAPHSGETMPPAGKGT